MTILRIPYTQNVDFFLAKPERVTEKLPLWLNTLRGIKALFKTLKCTLSTPPFFFLEFPPRIVYPLGGMFNACFTTEIIRSLGINTMVVEFDCCWLIKFDCWVNCIFQLSFYITFRFSNLYPDTNKANFINEHFFSDIIDCGSPMGMEDGKIPNSALKASSEVSKLQYKSKTLKSIALTK